MASPNMARYKIIERATKKKIQKAREEKGKPYTDKKSEYIIVLVISTYKPFQQDCIKMKAKVMNYRQHDRGLFHPSVIRCPICNKKISWDKHYAGYVCNSTTHERYIFEMVQKDIRRARGTIYIYNEQIKTAGKPYKKSETKKWICQLPHKKHNHRNKPCGRTFKKQADLLKHIKARHKIQPLKTIIGVYESKENGCPKTRAEIFDYVITSKCGMKPSIIRCPTCNKLAFVNIKEKCYECENNHTWYSYEITEPRHYYCRHCTRKIEEYQNSYRCTGRYRCPGTRAIAKEMPKKSKVQNEPNEITRELMYILKWNRLFIPSKDPDIEFHKRKKGKHTYKKKVPDNTEPSTPLFDHYKNKGRIVILKKSKETDIPIKEGKDPLAEIDLAVAKGFGYDKVKDHKRKCPVCKKVTAHLVYDRQMRAADEAPSIFYKCKKCGHTERVD